MVVLVVLSVRSRHRIAFRDSAPARLRHKICGMRFYDATKSFGGRRFTAASEDIIVGGRIGLSYVDLAVLLDRSSEVIARRAAQLYYREQDAVVAARAAAKARSRKCLRCLSMFEST